MSRDQFCATQAPRYRASVRRTPGIATVLLLLGSFSPDGISQEPDVFRATPTFAVGNGPTAIVSCDLNEDGLPDVVTANAAFDDIAVLRADGVGGFLPQVRFGVREDPHDLACADLDVDGHLDVVIASYNDTALAILRGRGDATFMLGLETLTVDGCSGAIAVGDVDDDELPDLAVGCNEIRVYRGRGDFKFHLRYTAQERATELVWAYVDADPFLDLVAANRNSHSVTIHYGAGDVSFSDVRHYTVGREPWSVAVGDLDRNGSIDLVTSNSEDISILFSSGPRAFSPAVSVQLGLFAQQVLVRDVSADGYPDILAVHPNSNDVSVLLNDGEGNFPTATRYGAGDEPKALIIADFTGDGVVDIATANYSSNNVSLLPGVGDGTFLWEPRFGVAPSPRAVTACDLNGDTIIDLASVGPESDSVSVLIGLGGGRYLPEARYEVAERPTDISCADFREDGAPDLLIAHEGSSEVSVLLGIGDGSFASKPRFSVGGQPQQLAICDTNNDGHLDVVASHNYASSPTLLLGDGQGFFGPPQSLGFSARRVSCADLNNDGYNDVFSMNLDTLRVDLNDGQGNFIPHDALDAGNWSVADLAVAHFDDDAFLDFAYIAVDRPEWSVYFNFSGGFAGPHWDVPGNLEDPQQLAAFDINGDGFTDLAVSDAVRDNIAVFLGPDTASLSEVRYFGVGEEPRGLTQADVDNDGDLDLIVANSTSNSLSVLFNTTVEGTIEDADRDSVPDADDNCPLVPNPEQENFDGDNMGDACDPDIDDDGVPNGPDVCDYTPLGVAVAPNGGLRSDADGDCDVDLLDYGIMQTELTGPGG